MKLWIGNSTDWWHSPTSSISREPVKNCSGRMPGTGRPSVIEEIPHLYALADLVVTRAGAGTLSELSLLSKAAIVVPLTGVAHDHQLKNAELLAAAGAIDLLRNEHLSILTEHAVSLLKDHDRRRAMGEALRKAFPSDPPNRIAKIVLDVA